ncbi:hypothetical protein [Bradyrhizobium sp.]|uniref:COG4223 family protein n=1 Tax=Bradyrhizobium sp. TaxID=376 RepID=UPI001ED3B008|nr:hypothetical protein [Bradyrhizobium sp.]MBV9982218.1 hypothetical protein [Bradyrhizobium sp.]
MAEDTLEQGGSVPEAGRVKRPPPTIDLEPSEVKTEAAPETEAAAAPEGDADPEVDAEAEPPREAVPPPRAKISPWVVAPFSGAVAAALVIGIGWMLGWPPVQAPSQVSVAALDELTGRLAAVEAKTSKPASDPVAAARADALDKALAALRADVAKQASQSEALASDVSTLKSAPRAAAAAPVDLSGINDRLAKLEQTARSQSAAIATETEKIADAKPADDMALRRVVAAALLDVAVRHGDPYAATLATAKVLAGDPQALKPLDAFADAGIPNPPVMTRELLTLVPKLSPPATDAAATTGSGIVDRLQAGAARLVRIERTDVTGSDRGAVVGRITAAALRNDFAEARKELSSLPPTDRAPAQAWLDKADARDAALAASRRFADDAMAALAKPAQ